MLSQAYGLGTFVENQKTIDPWVYFWALYSIPLILVSIFVAIPCCFGYYGSIRSLVLLKLQHFSFCSGLFWLSGGFCVIIWILGFFFYFWEQCRWNFEGDCMNL
jgi:hypothetical protein